MTKPRIPSTGKLDRASEAAHQHQLEALLAAMPHHDTPEARALRAVMRKAVGRGEGTGDGDGRTWRGYAPPIAANAANSSQGFTSM